MIALIVVVSLAIDMLVPSLAELESVGRAIYQFLLAVVVLLVCLPIVTKYDKK